MNKPLTVVTECVRACVSGEEAALLSGWQAVVGMAPSQLLLQPGMEPSRWPLVPWCSCHLSSHGLRFAFAARMGSVPGGPEIPTPWRVCPVEPLSINVGETCDNDVVHGKGEGILQIR